VTEARQASSSAPEIMVERDSQGIAIAVRALVERAAEHALAARGRFRLALAGGSTPRVIYSAWGDTLGAVPWSRVDIFFGDERAVPPDDPASNFKMARETFLDRVGVPAGNVRRMKGEAEDLDQAARDYERRLVTGSAAPWIDLAILGIGEDGHTASLFPGAVACRERSRLCVATNGPDRGPRRLTLTLPVFLDAGAVVFVAAGSEKAAILAAVLSDAPPERELPARAVLHRPGPVALCCDDDAAALLPDRLRSPPSRAPKAR
jgi:6-phosphogluconolactonase